MPHDCSKKLEASYLFSVILYVGCLCLPSCSMSSFNVYKLVAILEQSGAPFELCYGAYL